MSEQDERTERMRDLDAALDLLYRLTRDYDQAADLYCPKPPIEVRYIDALCDWEHGICLCPGCGKVVSIAILPHRAAAVVDADRRPHRCARYIAYRLQQAGVPGLGPVLAHYADQAPVPHPPQENGKGRTGV